MISICLSRERLFTGSIHEVVDRPRSLEKQLQLLYIPQSGHDSGARSLGFDPGPGLLQRRRSHSFGPWQPRRDSDPDLSACNSERPTVRPRGVYKHDHAHSWRVGHVVRWLVLTRLLRPVPVERAAVLAAVKTKPSAAQVGRS